MAEKRDQHPRDNEHHKQADGEETGLGEKVADDLFLVLKRT